MPKTTMGNDDNHDARHNEVEGASSRGAKAMADEASGAGVEIVEKVETSPRKSPAVDGEGGKRCGGDGPHRESMPPSTARHGLLAEPSSHSCRPGLRPALTASSLTGHQELPRECLGFECRDGEASTLWCLPSNVLGVKGDADPPCRSPGSALMAVEK